MLSVAQALDAILALMQPVAIQTVPLAQAAGRVLAEPVTAPRDQPPFAASSMDGYALRAADAVPGAVLRVAGEVPAGRSFPHPLAPGEAVRLFTGAPIPEGADAVLIQEDAIAEGGIVRVNAMVTVGENVRPAGSDFPAGYALAAPRRLAAADIALLAAMNRAAVPVRRRPVVALIPTGDELVEPGASPGPSQIIASTHLGLAALLAAHGADPRPMPIARDTEAALNAAFAAALALEPDLIVTLGGASVGDYDLVGRVLGAESLSFYKVAMRPGKPLMAGRIGGVPVVGLPGNPVSAMVCGHVFLRPALDALRGLPTGPLPLATARLAEPLGPGGPRAHYMRAALAGHGEMLTITPFAQQDSGAISGLARADALLVQPPHAPALPAGAPVPYVPLRDAG
jgi:molybdopterin molybdotransferase